MLLPKFSVTNLPFFSSKYNSGSVVLVHGFQSLLADKYGKKANVLEKYDSILAIDFRN